MAASIVRTVKLQAITETDDITCEKSLGQVTR